MRHWRRQLFRFSLIVALGAGLASFAASPEKPKTSARVAPEKIAPVIFTTTVTRASFDECLRPPRPDPDERPIGDLQANRGRKKIVLCG
jgi:hypothetical protein